GPVDSPASAGCRELIRKGVRPARSAADVIEDLRGIAPPDPPPPKAGGGRESAVGTLTGDSRPPPALDPVQQQIWDALDRPRHGDELARLVGRPVSELTQVLMGLELKKLIRRLPGNQYERR